MCNWDSDYLFQYRFSYGGIKCFFSHVGMQLRTEKMNGAVSDQGPNLDSRIYELSGCPAVPPAV